VEARPTRGPAGHPPNRSETITGEIHDDPLSANDDLRLVGQRYYDRASDDELVTTLVSSVADVLDVDPFDSTEMPPLFYR
jgi:hypothetical protein